MFWCVAPHTANPVLLSAALVVGAKPPWNQPQVTWCAFSRSPMFLPVMTPSALVAVWLVSEQSSKYGSMSPYMAPRPSAPYVPMWPGAGTSELTGGTTVVGPGGAAYALLSSPEIRLSAPGVDGP